MHISLRLIISLVALTLISILFAVWQVRAEDRVKRNELESRSRVLAGLSFFLPQARNKDCATLWMASAKEQLAGIVIYSRKELAY
jgi:hypothetical protein